MRCQCYLCCPRLNGDLGMYPLHTEQLSQLLCWAPVGRRSREELAQECKLFQPCHSTVAARVPWAVSTFQEHSSSSQLSLSPGQGWVLTHTPWGEQTAGAGNVLERGWGCCSLTLCPSCYLLMLPRLVQPWKPQESTQKGLVLGGKVVVIMLEETFLGSLGMLICSHQIRMRILDTWLGDVKIKIWFQ